MTSEVTAMYPGLDNQLQTLQNQLSQLSQMYNNSQTAPPMPSMPTMSTRQVHRVRGWKGAEDYSLHPNESELLQDDDDNVIFFKVCDANGMVKLRALEWHDVTDRYTNPPPAIDASGFVSKEEFNNFKSELTALVTEYMKGDKT